MSAIEPESAFTQLTAPQMERLRARADRVVLEPGAVLYEAGEAEYGFYVIESGEVEIVRAATPDSPSQVVVRHGAGRFLGELNMLTGQSAYLSARVSVGGTALVISRADFRRLMSEDPELSDVILRSFISRRKILQTGEAARSVEIIGGANSASTLALRNWATRLAIPHVWIDVDTPGGLALLTSFAATAADLPVVATPTGVLRQTTPGMLAEQLGLTFRSRPGEVFDLVIAGGGPAGLAAAMYGASEGLNTVLVEAVAVGGQAAASSRIENYLGFPSGLPGGELTARALVQAQKFGASVTSPCEASSLHVGDGQLVVTLIDGTEIAARAVIIASGAAYRKLDLEHWSEFEGAGIYYAATELEARSCGGRDAEVAVVGGANSAGQAALFLASRGAHVRLVVRSMDLAKGMSQYLADRIVADPRIDLHAGSEVVEVSGDTTLTGIVLRESATGTDADVACTGLFCFIGAVPATSWLAGVALDDAGFVFTDTDISAHRVREAYDLLGREPFPFETSVPGVFAVGDVRSGSMKRVAAAVGEGASAVRSVHQAIGS